MRYLLLIMVIVLAACGGKDTPPAAEPIITQATEIPTTTPTQPAPGHPCFDLNEADCAVIVNAADNLAALQSFAYDFDLTINASGLEALALLLDVPSTLNIESTGNGQFVFNVADMPLHATFNLDSTITPDAQPATASSFNLTLIDGYIFLPNNGEIVGVPFTPQALDALQLPLNLDAFIPLETLLSGSAADFGTFIMRDNLGNILNPSGTPINEFADFARVENDFIFTLDVKSLLNAPDFTRALMAASGQAGDDPTISFALQLLPTLLSEVESQAIITQTVTDGYTSHLTATVDFELDLAALLSTAPRDPEAESNPIRINAVLDLRLHDFDGSFEIMSPADARLLTEDEVQALFDDAVNLLP